jgi:histidinol-phosphate/aromatic aminotransferase/cobyric acid decarboxylase-like protein
LLVVDQAYGEFADESEPPDALFEAVAAGNICILRTFSKAYGLAGGGVGGGYFPAEIASELRKVLNPNNVSISAQAMAAAAMRDQDYMHDVVAQTAAIREEFCAACRQLGITVPQSHTNFALLVFDDVGLAQKVDKTLRQNNILMRGMVGYGLPQALRATICARPEMARALDVLTEVLT